MHTLQAFQYGSVMRIWDMRIFPSLKKRICQGPAVVEFTRAVPLVRLVPGPPLCFIHISEVWNLVKLKLVFCSQ